MIKATCAGCGEDCTEANCTYLGETYHLLCVPVRKPKKRNAAFFVSDVNNAVDYIEQQAEQYSDSVNFKRAVVNKLAATYVFGDQE